MSVCVICHRAMQQERMACAVCQQRMDDRLADVLEFYALAEGELIPGSGGERGTERGLGVRLSALDFLAGHDAVAVLASWESDWRETYGLSTLPMLSRPRPLLGRSVAFLRAWLPRACDDFAAIDDFAREVDECWGAARSAARCSPSASQTITCPADSPSDDGSLCGYRIRVDADTITGRVTCRRCRTDWEVMHLIHVAIATPGADIWADPEAASGYFRVSATTLRQWAKDGRIQSSHGRYELHSIHEAIRRDGYTRLARMIVG